MTVASPKPKVSIIVAALLPKYGIGNKGQLPWRLKQEMKYFRKVTTNTIDPNKQNIVIMGRKTWESIPVKFRPLPGRINVILTRHVSKYEEDFKAELSKHNQDKNEPILHISDSIDNALNNINLGNIEEVFIIGGAEIYNQTLNSNFPVDRLLLTEVKYNKDEELEMDAFINVDKSLWTKKDVSHITDYLSKKSLETEFQVLDNTEGDFSYDFTLWERE